MHHADIYCLIQKSGTTLTAIAKEEGVTVEAVSAVVRGRISSRPIALAIAAKVNRSLKTLWGERYSKPSTNPLARHHKKAAA